MRLASERSASLAACEGLCGSLREGRSRRQSAAWPRIVLRTMSCSRSCSGAVMISSESCGIAALRVDAADDNHVAVLPRRVDAATKELDEHRTR